MKDQVIALRKEGYGYEMIHRKTQVPVRTIRRWTEGIEVDGRKAYDKAIEEMMSERFPKNKGAIRERLISERGHKCQSCENTEWMGQPIPLEMHRQEQGGPYTRENVLLLCPNCHAQTDTWRRKRGSRPTAGVNTLRMCSV